MAQFRDCVVSCVSVCLIGCSGSDPVTVFAAASTGPAMEDAVSRWGGDARVHSAASGTLLKQMQLGMDVDILLLARPQAGRKHHKQLLTNTLVLFGDRLVEEDSCIVIGDPGFVPAGQYARDHWQWSNAWDQVQPRLRYAKDAPSIPMLVSQGLCPRGVAYRTDLVHQDFEFRRDLFWGEAPTYPLYVLNDSGDDLYAWLQTEAGLAAFVQAGFGLP